MKSDTIEEAIIHVLKRNSHGLTPAEITSKIIEQKLYTFHAKEPESIVDHAIRKSCVGVHIEVSKPEKDKMFKIASDGRYKLKDD